MSAHTPDQERIFNAAAELTDPNERAAFLDAACGDNPQLRAEIEDLLQHDHEAGSFLNAAASPAMTQAFPPSAEGPGTLIGPYKLLQQIGEGGFGVVYMAEQTRPVRRKVALKIIKPGMDTKDVIARFEAERQALALMEHPNIAKVLDAGTVGEVRNAECEVRNEGDVGGVRSTPHSTLRDPHSIGRPYFVMELVKGVPVTEFCDSNSMGTAERLNLIISICQAVQHAHHKGVIHRDLKPSNVMVTLHDGKPVVKVIDFGVSKAISQQLTEKTLFTAYGQMVGTPAYMSPEQAEMSGLDIDTRSDIYSLGVLLYEMLTGTTPLDASRLRGTAYAELQRIIREQEPPKPSTRVSTLGAASDKVARQRGTEPKKLVQLLRGELDWIVLKALEKDRNRRYATPGDFAADIQRYLHQEAIIARPPSAAYKLRKFAQRHKAAVATATAIAAALLLGTVISSWQAIRASREAQRATREALRARLAEQEAIGQKQRADEQAVMARAVHDFLQLDLLGQSDVALEARGDAENPAVAQFPFPLIIERAAQNIEGGKFAGQPLSEAAVRLTLGNLFRLTGQFSQSQAHLERSVELFAATLGDAGPETLNSKRELAGLYQSQGKHERAEAIFCEVLKGSTDKLGPTHRSTLTAKNNLALFYHDRQKYDQAEPLYREALQTCLASLGQNDPLTQIVQSNLADMYRKRGDNQQAETLYQELVRQRTASHGADHPDTVLSKRSLAQVLRALDKHKQADALFPYRGPINAIGDDRKSYVLILPTHEADEKAQQELHEYVHRIRDQAMAGASIITDQEALKRDFSANVLLVYGTPVGNLWLARHVPELQKWIEPAQIIADQPYSGTDLRFITTWPNPFHAGKGMTIYTAQRTDEIPGINAVFHGPSDYVIARGTQILRNGHYAKDEGGWRFDEP
jgi:serine/threonine protein kinase